jgi:hypothetical protein
MALSVSCHWLLSLLFFQPTSCTIIFSKSIIHVPQSLNFHATVKMATIAIWNGKGWVATNKKDISIVNNYSTFTDVCARNYLYPVFLLTKTQPRGFNQWIFIKDTPLPDWRNDQYICTIYTRLDTCHMSISRFSLRDKVTLRLLKLIFMERMWSSDLGRWT